MRSARFFAAALLLAAVLPVLLLTGCGPTGNDYISVVDHNAPYAYHPEVTESVPETEPPIPTVSDYYQMRAVLQDFVYAGVEHGQLILSGYEGDPERDLQVVNKYLSTQDPICAYAVDYFVFGRKAYGSGWLITMDAIYRRSLGEIQAIVPVRGNDAAMEMLRKALLQQESSVTLRVSGFLSTDFAGSLREYAMLHPYDVPVIPQISAAAYPENGNVRVLEVHFVYDYDRETLKNMRTEAAAVFNSAYNYIRYSRSDTEKLQLLFSYLTSRFSYTETENASVYQLLCRGESSSLSIASAVNWICGRDEMESFLVQGTKDGEPYAWNIIRVDGEFRHFDFHADALAQQTPAGRLDEEMEGYEWNPDLYPACELQPAEPESSEPESTGETSGGQ